MLHGVFRVGGKVKWRSLKTDNLREARRILSTEIDKAEKTADAIKSDMTLAELIALYESNLCAFATKTQRCRRSIIKVLRNSWQYGFEMKVSRITTAHLKSWLAMQFPRIKAVSVRDYLKVLRGIFNLAVDARVIVDSPVNAIKPPRVEKPIRLTPTWEQALQLISAVRN
jgi:site-specific recombinase XerD